METLETHGALCVIGVHVTPVPAAPGGLVSTPAPTLGRSRAQQPVHNICTALVLGPSRALESSHLSLKGLDGVTVLETEILFDVFFENDN